MSERYCYELWQSALKKLQTLLNENASASQDKDQLAKTYLHYLQVLKQLDEVHTYIRQPQHREAVATALLYCAGLLTEAWSALVAANKGIDVIDFGNCLLELQLTPDDLEVLVPAVLKNSERLGQAKLNAVLAAVPEASTGPATNSSVPEYMYISAIKRSPKAVPITSACTKPSEEKDKDSPDEAATKIQAAWRGCRDRRIAADRRTQELEYLGMYGNDTVATNPSRSGDLEEAAVARRQRRHREYEQARLEIEELLRVQETPLMVLEERTQVNSCLEAKIKNEGERWPDVPLDGELVVAVQERNAASSENQNPKMQSKKQKQSSTSSKYALVASPVTGKARKVGTGSSSSSSGGNNEAPKSSVQPTFASQLEELINKWKANVEKELANEGEDQAISTDITTAIADEPLPALEGLPVPRRGSSIDAIDLKLLTKSTRPRIKERVRLTVREQARQTAAAANAARPAPSAAKQKQSSSKVSAPAAKKPVEKASNTGTKDSKPGTGTIKEPKQPTREPLPPLRDLEEIFKDLAEHQVAVKCPETKFSNFIGTYCLVQAAGDTQPTPVKKAKSGGKAANIAAKTSEPLVLYPELSFAQIRQILTVKCALPLAIHGSSNCGPAAVTTALIYGPPGSGKTMLVHAIAHESKASSFDLSPKTLAGKYPGQLNIDIAVQSVFAAAKAAAPAVIAIDNVEQLFIRDERRVAQLTEEIGGGEPVNRIRRQLILEIAALKPQDGVLVLCTSKEPHACVSADEATFVSFFQFLVSIPLPDDRCRGMILQNFALEMKCGRIWTTEKLHLSAQLTQGYTAGALKSIMSRSLEMYRASKEKNADIVDCFIEAAAFEVKPESNYLQTVAEWTARAHAMLGKAATAAPPPLK